MDAPLPKAMTSHAKGKAVAKPKIQAKPRAQPKSKALAKPKAKPMPQSKSKALAKPKIEAKPRAQPKALGSAKPMPQSKRWRALFPQLRGAAVPQEEPKPEPDDGQAAQAAADDGQAADEKMTPEKEKEPRKKNGVGISSYKGKSKAHYWPDVRDIKVKEMSKVVDASLSKTKRQRLTPEPDDGQVAQAAAEQAVADDSDLDDGFAMLGQPLSPASAQWLQAELDAVFSGADDQSEASKPEESKAEESKAEPQEPSLNQKSQPEGEPQEPSHSQTMAPASPDEEQDKPIPPWRKPQPLVPPPAKRQATVANANCQWVTQKMVDDFCCKLKPEARAAFMALYPRDQRLLLALCVENRADLIKDRNTHAFVCSWAAQRMRSGKQW